MAVLNGQNFRIMTYVDSTLSCIGMATNCVVTLTNNTEESSTKDDVGMASKPTTTTKTWSVQVDSLNVTDMGTLLTAIKSLTPFRVMWDETNTSNNQTRVKATYARIGDAFLSDLVFTFNDRENSVKNVQFIGNGALSTVAASMASTPVAAGSYTKGQYVRLFLSSDNSADPVKVIGYAKQMSMHVAMQLEDGTTKDTTGTWLAQVPTGLSYDISSQALIRGADNITSQVAAQGLSEIESIYEAGTPVKWKIANIDPTSANNRTASSTIVSGSALVQTLTINAQNRANATFQTQLAGYGAYTVASS